jgi:hypothetical protein
VAAGGRADGQNVSLGLPIAVGEAIGIAGAGGGGGVGMRLAGIIAFTRVVAIAARDMTSDFAFATRFTALLRTDTALRFMRVAALRAFTPTLRAVDFALLAARRTRPRAWLRARRAALLARAPSLRSEALAFLFFAIDWISLASDERQNRVPKWPAVSPRSATAIAGECRHAFSGVSSSARLRTATSADIMAARRARPVAPPPLQTFL